MTKRIRRDRRIILVDSEKMAMNTEQICLKNKFVEGEFGSGAYTTCYASNLGNEFESKWAVIFYCTLDEWNHIMKYYDLIRLDTYKYHYEYELRE